MADTIDVVDPPPPPPAEVTPVPATAIPMDAPPPQEGCMSKRSCLEKCLIIFVIIVLIIIVAAVIAFVVFYFFQIPPEGTCLEDKCVKAASHLKSRMGEGVEPCVDFYQYACGGWHKGRVLDQDQRKEDSLLAVADSTSVRLKTLLEEPINREDSLYTKDPRSFYKSCMDMAKRNELRLEPLMEVFNAVGDFPAIDADWNETVAEMDFQKSMIALFKMGASPFFRVSLFFDSYEKAKKFKISPNTHALTEEALTEMLTTLGADESTAVTDAKDVANFQQELAQMVMRLNDGDTKEEKAEVMGISMLETSYKLADMKWLEFFQGLITNDGIQSKQIDQGELVKNADKEYLVNVGELISKSTKRVLLNYMMTRQVHFMQHLGEDFRNSKTSKDIPLWRECAHTTASAFDLSLGRMYVDSYFSGDSKKYIKTVMEDINRVFKRRLDENDAISDQSKSKAETRLDKMAGKERVGFPDEIYDEELLNDVNEQIHSDQETYFENVVSAAKFKFRETMKDIGVKNIKERWTVFPEDINANYNSIDNEVVLPMALLQEPYFSPDYSNSMNYAGIGIVAAHEMMNAFKISDKSVWTDGDRGMLKKRTECLVAQYGCYKWDKMSMDGSTALDENIADNGALTNSYKAYRDFIERRGSEEPRLPGLDLNHNQIFFLSYAQTFCALYQDSEKQSVLNGPQAPPLFRVRGPIENSKEFGEAFRCQLGIRMSPMQKCVVW